VDRVLIESLEKLVDQSAQALGPEHPSTLMLRQQLAAALAAQTPQPGRAPKVFWLKPAAPEPPSGEG